MSDQEVINQLKALRDQVSQLTVLVNAMAMSQNLRDLASKIDGDQKKETPDGQLTLEEAKERLESATEVKFHKDYRYFLLHRPTETAEFEASEKDGGKYRTSEQTTWYAALPRASDEQGMGNPLVSVWVGETEIVEIRHAAANNAQYGEAMDNPAAQKFEVDVKPGEYKIYAEVKQQ
jgi:hypothetical protein